MRKKKKSLPVLSLATSNIVVVAGTGSSLTRDDAQLLDDLARQGAIKLIAIQDNYRLMPHAQYVYGCDHAWWNHHYDDVVAAGTLAQLLCPDHHAIAKFPLLETVVAADWRTPRGGLSNKDDMICTGFSSGHQALHLAYNMRPDQILLVGLDYQGTHWFGAHPDVITKTPSNFRVMINAMNVLAADIKEQSNIDVINCSPASALTCFTKMPLRDALRIGESENRDSDT